MQRKFLKTFFVTIVLLFSLLLSGCKIPPQGPLALSIAKMETSYDLNEPYLITLQYGYIGDHENKNGGVGLLSCWRVGGTEEEILLEINPFFTEANVVEKKVIKIGSIALSTMYKYNQSKTFEISKSHFTEENGTITFYLKVGPINEDETVSNQSVGKTVSIHYEKKDGKIYFEKVK